MILYNTKCTFSDFYNPWLCWAKNYQSVAFLREMRLGSTYTTRKWPINCANIVKKLRQDFDYRDVVYYEVISPSQTANKEYYLIRRVICGKLLAKRRPKKSLDDLLFYFQCLSAKVYFIALIQKSRCLF